MPDYWIKISETEDDDLKHHHYLMTAKDEKEAKHNKCLSASKIRNNFQFWGNTLSPSFTPSILPQA